MEKQHLNKEIDKYNRRLNDLKAEIRKAVVGQEDVVDSLLKCILCRGHILFESVPGLAKTFLVRVLTKTIKEASFQRIQFTPDLLPTDITGITVYEEDKGFYTIKGPIFANIVLADEINRSPPKVQSAMLQAMQEREVTIGRETFPLPKPFMVLATQNPLEQQGVYPLALAQIDRFLFKVFISYPKIEEEIQIIDQNADVVKMEDFGIKEVLGFDDIESMQSITKMIHMSEEVKAYLLNIVEATRYPDKYGVQEGKYMQWGASPRASINLALGARATAFLNGRDYVTPDDVRDVAYPVLRHRVVLNYEGKAREVSPDKIIASIIQKVPVI